MSTEPTTPKSDVFTLNELRASWIDGVYQDGKQEPMLRLRIKVDRHGPDGRQNGIDWPELLLESYTAESLLALLQARISESRPGSLQSPDLSLSEISQHDRH